MKSVHIRNFSGPNVDQKNSYYRHFSSSVSYTLSVEISKTLNNLIPSLMSNIFQLRLTNRPPRGKYKLNLEIPKTKQVKFGSKSLRAFGPKIWNSSTHHIKSAEDVKTFKRIIKKWNVYNVSAQFAQITFITCSVFVTITVHPLQFLLSHINL